MKFTQLRNLCQICIRMNSFLYRVIGQYCIKRLGWFLEEPSVLFTLYSSMLWNNFILISILSPGIRFFLRHIWQRFVPKSWKGFWRFTTLLSCPVQKSTPHARYGVVQSFFFFKHSSDGAHTTSGNGLFYCLIALSVKKFLLCSSLLPSL